MKKELGLPENFGFHFKRNSDRARRSFLTAIAPYSFFYYGIVINKDPKKLWGEGFRNKESFYKYACGLVFENAKEKLVKATVVIDESGNFDFKCQLAKYLWRKTERGAIAKVKMQCSTRNNLLQLADYVASVIARSVQNRKKWADEYRKIIAHREISVQVWPK
ncbi:MAG: hypothetical protein V1763_01520 [Parcubacteria group bacterium]